jgi:hypothetical protein
MTRRGRIRWRLWCVGEGGGADRGSEEAAFGDWKRMIFENLTTLNQWISSHKELVSLVAIPVVTFTVTYLINRSSEKRAAIARKEAEVRAAEERLLQLELSRRMKLADFRQNWINEVRQDFALILGIVPSPIKASQDLQMEVNTRIQSVLLRMNPHEDLPKEIFDRLISLLHSNPDKKEEIGFELLNLVNKFLKSEWDRLKVELSEYKKLEATT